MKNYQSLLETTRNTRDLGGYACPGGVTRHLSLLRSDVQKAPSPRDIRFLAENNIRTVIDMREDAAVLRVPGGFAGADGFTYYRCPITEGSGIPSSPAEVPATYMAIAESAGARAAFCRIAEAEGGVIFNCSAGKDRTGVISAVILLLCGVSIEDVVADYLLTREYNRLRPELLRERFTERQIEVIIPHREYMLGFIDLLYTRYGSSENYLLSVGLTFDQVRRIRSKLLP